MAGQTGIPISVHQANISTAAVEVKTLTIKGRQVTLAVFRQLPLQPLLDFDEDRIALNGKPWGRVHYFWDDCAKADPSRHLHVVWQHGDELRRACVDDLTGNLWKRVRRRQEDRSSCVYVNGSYLHGPAAVQAREQQLAVLKAEIKALIDRGFDQIYRQLTELPQLFIAV